MVHYGTEAGFATYAASVGVTLADGAVLPALVRASIYVDGRYGRRFVGSRATGYAQARAWPRVGAATAEGFAIPSNEVPAAVENATYEAAIREVRAPGSLSPDYVASKTVKRTKVGPIEKEYAVSDSGSAADIRPVVAVIDEMLADLLTSPAPAVLVV